MAAKRPWRIAYRWGSTHVLAGVSTHRDRESALAAVERQIKIARNSKAPFAWRLERRQAPGPGGIRTIDTGTVNHAGDPK